jgi:glutaminase
MSSKLATDASVACANFVVVVVDVTGSTHSAVDAAPETAVLQSLAVFINSYLFMSRSHDLALVAVGSDRSDIAFRSARELLRSDLDEAKGEMSIADIATASLLESIRRNTTSHGAPSTEGVGYVAMAKGLSQAMCGEWSR